MDKGDIWFLCVGRKYVMRYDDYWIELVWEMMNERNWEDCI